MIYGWRCDDDDIVITLDSSATSEAGPSIVDDGTISGKSTNSYELETDLSTVTVLGYLISLDIYLGVRIILVYLLR